MGYVEGVGRSDEEWLTVRAEVCLVGTEQCHVAECEYVACWRPTVLASSSDPERLSLVSIAFQTLHHDTFSSTAYSLSSSGRQHAIR